MRLGWKNVVLSFLLVANAWSAHAETLQCVTFARQQSGIFLRGDAWTWWTGAAGQYDRGQAPRPGAVIVFKKHGSMSHGHVAVVAEVISNRRVRVDHANWAPHRGHGRGQIAKQVIVSDVSRRNDWSEVRVWNEASSELGTRIYPTYGFIYRRAGAPDLLVAEALADNVPADANFPPGDIAPPTMGQGPDTKLGTIGAVANLTELLAPSSVTASLLTDSNFLQ